ncbi:carboxymuconolactone decarboxylase family protein [Cochlodiniinecator piscidefendens]|uniref:hypothetical protein n=1 Tax=Cochlodiniinecator piscidefendens TaxID=2715756 RepID=UPI00140E83A7|nr:hypothetical protein [Cochlodiniinecator piscidefendens]
MPSANAKIAYVDVIPQAEATGDLAAAYDAVKGADGTVENLYLAMSQTPNAIKPADDHYLALLHNDDSPLKPWLAELVSTYVAILCGSAYATANHGENFCMYYGNREEAEQILAALQAETWESLIKVPETRAALFYTRKLSLTPDQISVEDVNALREAGYCDKGISYIVQLVASFAYWARMINGLGTQLGATVGLSNAQSSVNEKV